jgi:hypothetical protein
MMKRVGHYPGIVLLEGVRRGETIAGGIHGRLNGSDQRTVQKVEVELELEVDGWLFGVNSDRELNASPLPSLSFHILLLFDPSSSTVGDIPQLHL